MKPSVTKAVMKASPEELLKKMLSHFEIHNFVSHRKTFGFNGEMVKNIVKNEWWLSNFIFSDEPVFKTTQPINEAFPKCLQVAETLPFSVVEIAEDFSLYEKNHEEERGKDDMLGLLWKNGTILRKTSFCSPAASTAFFHKQQRERKIWWRKFSALPSRFSLTEITSSEDKDEQNVEIQADFPWRIESVEKVKCLTQLPFERPEIFQVKEGRKLIVPHVVVNECHLEKATAVFICDAYDKINENTDRDMMRFHRKLAPFKITFVASATSANIGKELSDLALVLARKIRKLGLPCLLLQDLTRRSLESQFFRADAMGIPYSIVLNDRTLQEGIIGIRSRDTTLKEQSHVGVVVPHIEKLFKNY